MTRPGSVTKLDPGLSGAPGYVLLVSQGTGGLPPPVPAHPVYLWRRRLVVTVSWTPSHSQTHAANRAGPGIERKKAGGNQA